MAAAKLDFSNGFLGIERCEDKLDGKQFLKAFIFSKRTGLKTTAPVEIADVLVFAREVTRQACLAHINAKNDDALVDLALFEMLKEIEAEQTAQGQPGYRHPQAYGHE